MWEGNKKISFCDRSSVFIFSFLFDWYLFICYNKFPKTDPNRNRNAHVCENVLFDRCCSCEKLKFTSTLFFNLRDTQILDVPEVNNKNLKRFAHIGNNGTLNLNELLRTWEPRTRKQGGFSLGIYFILFFS